MAAHEGSDHAAEHEQHGIGEATLEQLRADLARLSGLSDTGAPFPAFLDMRRVRDRIYRLLDRRQRPARAGRLYFLLGCLNGLMGITANRLGYPDAAEELLRAGWAYANVIDHNALRGMLRAEALLRHVLARPVHRQPRPGRRRPAVRLAGPGRRQPAP